MWWVPCFGFSAGPSPSNPGGHLASRLLGHTLVPVEPLPAAIPDSAKALCNSSSSKFCSTDKTGREQLDWAAAQAEGATIVSYTVPSDLSIPSTVKSATFVAGYGEPPRMVAMCHLVSTDAEGGGSKGYYCHTREDKAELYNVTTANETVTVLCHNVEADGDVYTSAADCPKDLEDKAGKAGNERRLRRANGADNTAYQRSLSAYLPLYAVRTRIQAGSGWYEVLYSDDGGTETALVGDLKGVKNMAFCGSTPHAGPMCHVLKAGSVVYLEK